MKSKKDLNVQSNSNKQIGCAGEDYAADYLKKKKYKILGRNYRNKMGEIDIIAEKHGIIAFVEVKTRNKSPMVAPSYAVNKKKQEHIIKCSAYYLLTQKVKLQPRFDIIEVIVDSKTLKLVSINHIENAFIQGGDYARF